MKIRQLGDDEAVMPVIGIILMVAITVILASVMGTFVLGIGDVAGDSAPNAKFDFEYDEGAQELTITHTDGDELMENDLTIKGADSGDVSDPDFTGDGNADDEFGAATTFTVSGVKSDDEVLVIWTNEDGDTTRLSTWEGPDA